MAPWCGHCKKFAPVFEEAATLTQSTDQYINFGEMDCDANLITCGFVSYILDLIEPIIRTDSDHLQGLQSHGMYFIQCPLVCSDIITSSHCDDWRDIQRCCCYIMGSWSPITERRGILQRSWNDGSWNSWDPNIWRMQIFWQTLKSKTLNWSAVESMQEAVELCPDGVSAISIRHI